MVLSDLMKLGTLSVFISYAVVIFEPIQQLARLLADLISCQANIERVTDLLEQKPNVTDREDVIEKYGDAFMPKKENWEKIKGDIVFDDVSFRRLWVRREPENLRLSILWEDFLSQQKDTF